MRKRRRETKQVEVAEAEVRCPFDFFAKDTRYRVLRIHVKVGDDVNVGDLLCSAAKLVNENEAGTISPTEEEEEADEELATATFSEEKQVVQVVSAHDGKMSQILVKEDEIFQADDRVLMKIHYCRHDVIMPNGLCAACGRLIKTAQLQLQNSEDDGGGEDSQDSNAIIVNVEGGMKFLVSKHEAEDVSKNTISRLFRAKKLSLVLDLDHTILHCTDDPRANSFRNRPHVYAFELDGQQMYLKPRPGLHHFLETMRERFEMHVYTAGTRPYATRVCSIIDPHGRYFKDRIISRDDNPELSVHDKRISRLFPVDDSMVVIVDDRKDVWHKSGSDRNLLTCQAYFYFLGMHDVNNASEHVNEPRPGASQEEEAKDIGLSKVEEILLALHGEFYQDEPSLERQLVPGQGRDVKEILKRLHARVFANKRILVFDPELQPQEHALALRELALQCGAQVRDEVDVNTTHLISNGGTQLCFYARNLPGAAIWVVSPEWLERCAHFWRHVREESYSHFATQRS